MKKFLTLLTIAVALVSCGKKSSDYAGYVNPMIGTDFHGHTFPGATAPFGMIQLSPDSRIGMTWDGCSGYHYSDSVIYGFTHTHLNGTGCFDLCDILFMPTVGDICYSNDISNGTQNSYVSRFSHDKEHAEAGYYSVILDDYNIKVELTATERVAFHKYTYPKGGGNVIIDLTHQDDVINSSLTIVGDNEIVGERRSRYWARDEELFFVARFSEPFTSSSLIFNDSIVAATSVEGENVKGYVSFDGLNKPLYITVGISANSIENARKNISDAPSFEEARNNTSKLWNNELSKIKVESMNEDDKVIFYTALYHSMIAPNLYSDINGEYRGRDFKTHRADHDYYTVFSLWDTYRALHPLLSIIDQKRTNDFVNTMLLQYQQGGRLPVWELAANETNCMIGNHAIPVIYDAFAKGILNYDKQLALNAMVHSADLDLFGLKAYKEYGFIPSEIEHESVSKTLEYAYDDWCIAQMAYQMGDNEKYERFIKRAQSYKNIFDPITGFHRAKANNMWFVPFDPTEVNFNYTEANCWQYNFHVQQDVTALMNMYGGAEAFAAKLDKLFTESSSMTGRDQVDISGVIGQYAQGNEPSHHVAYLFNYAGQPYKTQKIVRQIMSELFENTPDGLCGNDDCGQMSAWYVFSSLGFYPVCPGDNKFILGSPYVKKADISLENGSHFTVSAENQSEKNIYVDRVELNGYEYTKSYITYGDIANGGKLVFYMSDEPNKSFGNAEEDRPKNLISDYLINPVPYFTNESAIFTDKVMVGIAAPVDGCKIYYTIDGKAPTAHSIEYTEPFELTKTTTVKAVSINGEGVESNVISTEFSKILDNRKIKLISKYESQYSAGGNNALIDRVRGGINFRTGGWQGYQGQDIVAVVDLNDFKRVRKISMGFLQDVDSWIFYPTKVTFYVSEDGQNFVEYGSVENTISERDIEPSIHDFVVRGDKNAKYVKVVAKSIISCPQWHEGAGGMAWLFADEITVE